MLPTRLIPADTPVDPTSLDPEDFQQFFYNTYNNNSAKGIYLTPGNYQVGAAIQDL